MTAYAVRLESGTDTAARMRLADLLMLPVGDAPLKSRSALRPDGGGAVSVVAGSMNVQVAPFMAWVQGGVSVTQGGYTFVLDAALTLALSPGHASLSRTDTIAAVVRDTAYDGGGQTKAEVIVITGTPGSGAPVLPTSAVALRDITVPAGLSAGSGGLQPSNLATDRRRYLVDAPTQIIRAGRVSANLDANSRATIAWPGGEFPTKADSVTIHQYGTFNSPYGGIGDFQVESLTKTGVTFHCNASPGPITNVEFLITAVGS